MNSFWCCEDLPPLTSRPLALRPHLPPLFFIYLTSSGLNLGVIPPGSFPRASCYPCRPLCGAPTQHLLWCVEFGLPPSSKSPLRAGIASDQAVTPVPLSTWQVLDKCLFTQDLRSESCRDRTSPHVIILPAPSEHSV